MTHEELLSVLEPTGLPWTYYHWGAPPPPPYGVYLDMEDDPFYADDVAYYVAVVNGGYQGDLKIALIPDAFAQEVLGETLHETDQVLVESSAVETKPFALMFEFKGDQHAVRHVLYNCTAARPNVTGATTTNTKEPQTSTLTLFENVAYLMARHADPTGVPDSVDEWMENFETFSIYTVFHVIQDLWEENLRTLNTPKKIASTEREMTSALLLLRAAQLGISMSDLGTLTIGMILDMYTEVLNDQEDYPVLATQEDFDRF